MGGFFGIVSARPCIADLFYGVDYHSHLGTKRAGIVTYNKDMKLFRRSIHNIENAYFRNKFGDELGKFVGTSGIGVISDTDAQPIVVNSHLGRFARSTTSPNWRRSAWTATSSSPSSAPATPTPPSSSP